MNAVTSTISGALVAGDLGNEAVEPRLGISEALALVGLEGALASAVRPIVADAVEAHRRPRRVLRKAEGS